MSAPIPRDERLIDYATDRQREVLEAYWATGSQRAAAERLGTVQSAVSRTLTSVRLKAARAGYAPEAGVEYAVPEGHRLKGVSTLVDGEGKKRAQWLKTTEDRERQAELLREIVEGLRDEVPRAAALPPVPLVNDQLLAAYPVGDHHFGLYAWGEEAGADYDLAIAERLLSAAFGALAAALPPASRGLIVLLGDLFHYDGLEPVTPTAKNQLDSDGRYALMVRTGIRVVRRLVDVALGRHATVELIVQAGNHDPSTAIFLAEALAAFYDAEPRIAVDRSPAQFHYAEHGECLIGVCHGHEAKLAELPLIMATDRPEAWGRTRHHHWLTGHVHHDRVLDVKGTKVESFRVLPPTDAWAHGKGYRSSREMKALLFHARYGESQRIVVRPEMFEEPAP